MRAEPPPATLEPGRYLGPLIVFALIFGASLTGIWSRSELPLANFWPANALLLGLFVRWPSLRTPASWIGAIAGYLAADLLTGSALAITIWLTVPNLTGPIIGLQLFDRLSEADRRLTRLDSVLYVLGITIILSVCAAVPGIVAAHHYFGMTVQDAFFFWTVAEITSCLGLLPVILAAPTLKQMRDWWQNSSRRIVDILSTLGPLAALIVALLLGILVDGPGALAFAVPPLLWCALRRSVFQTAFLVQLATAWNLLGMGFGYLDYVEYDQLSSGTKVSLQAGLALISLGPLMVAVSTGAREQAYQALTQIAARDELTAALTRREFNLQTEKTVANLAHAGHHAAVLMLDIDHFKQINDRHGHAAGDTVLQQIAAIIQSALRETDIFGRVGGEEFAVLLPGVSQSLSEQIAANIRSAVEKTTFIGSGNAPISATLSIGLVYNGTEETHIPFKMSDMLAAADEALYEAKLSGRNQVRIWSPELSMSSRGSHPLAS